MLQKLGTIAQSNSPIPTMIISNSWQKMARQWQESFYENPYSHSPMDKR